MSVVHIPGSAGRILIVDDANLVRMFYGEALRGVGYEVDEALNGLEALEKLLIAPVGLIVLDVNMPRMDGMTFLRTLRRADLPLAATPVLVTSTEAAPRDAELARAAGANFYLVKPVLPAALISYAALLYSAPAVAAEREPARKSRRGVGMNTLLQQFLVECRDLIDMTTVDLLALENAPDDKERLDGAFRGFHTLKGAAGIVEFAAMGRLLHAAEEVLASVRAGSRVVTGALVSDCLACLDQVTRWLGDMTASGEIPVEPFDAVEQLVARLSAAVQSASGSMPSTPEASAARVPGWLAPLLARHHAKWHRARAALRYSPEADCFLRGEDPVAAISRIILISSR